MSDLLPHVHNGGSGELQSNPQTATATTPPNEGGFFVAVREALGGLKNDRGSITLAPPNRASGGTPEKRTGNKGIYIGTGVALTAVIATAIVGVQAMRGTGGPKTAGAPKGPDACEGAKIPGSYLNFADYDFSKVDPRRTGAGFEVIGDPNASAANPTEYVEISWAANIPNEMPGNFGILIQDIQTGETWLSELPSWLTPQEDSRYRVHVPVGQRGERMLVYMQPAGLRYPEKPVPPAYVDYTRYNVNSTDPNVVAETHKGVIGTNNSPPVCIVTKGEVDTFVPTNKVGTLDGRGTGDTGEEPTD